MADTINTVNKQLDAILKPLFENKIFVASLGLFLAIYAGWLAPALPNSVIGFFDTAVGKLLFIFLIAFVASRNVPNSLQVALIVAVAYLVTLQIANRRVSEHFEDKIKDQLAEQAKNSQVSTETYKDFEDNKDWIYDQNIENIINYLE